MDTDIQAPQEGTVAERNDLHGISYKLKTIKVPTISLDCFVKENQLEVELIKVDLEGKNRNFSKELNTIKMQKRFCCHVSAISPPISLNSNQCLNPRTGL